MRENEREIDVARGLAVQDHDRDRSQNRGLVRGVEVKTEETGGGDDSKGRINAQLHDDSFLGELAQ